MVDLLGRIDEGVSKYARANDISRNLATWREKVLEMLTIIAKGKGAKNLMRQDRDRLIFRQTDIIKGAAALI